MRKLPPLNAVRAFEAAARYISFTKAADELRVTHGAISRQVALLEDWFGVKLFRRAPSQLTLTPAGHIYYREVTAVLDRLALASMNLKQHGSNSVLRISAPPTFTMRWLIRRISSFQRLRPDVEPLLTTSIAPINTHDNSFDVAIRGNVGDPPQGWRSQHFMTEMIAPVCHVDLLSRQRLGKPQDLKDHTLITYLTEPYPWRQWFSQAGVEIDAAQETLRFEQMFFALQATQERMGIGLFPLFLVIDELISGQLCLPFGELGLRKREYQSYSRVENDGSNSPVRDFAAWLIEAGHETEQFMLNWAGSMGWRF
ncbi:LysR substrate-binding domain-containing protein [Bradyrhizobium erythrophlei]|jgi:LysR family glycine cleavage system transcriptional activator|uniref:LysR family transcriptional regulator, glycine cleavage system transcriptional activator n=1 Tax=Bradyrhizobium erythrophlei TaxID=1437360 RepID=A0A1M7TDF7_9BRAD|nr:LysR substrate-binding domain-containing protein [Bradyrhizobium erythrophlei]SHN68733.1 LysR family transcriptional regulator, glycine cleavage system transcriptional activator [Bradyrhizobium erythrophlei]